MFDLRKIVGPSVVGLICLAFMGTAFAQDPIGLALSDEQGVAGDSIAVTFSFEGNGETSGVSADFTFDDTDVDSVDFSNCLSGNNALISSCLHPGGDTSRVRINLAQTSDTALTDFDGTIVFNMAAGASPGVIALEWDPESYDTSDPEADINATDGSIEILDIAPSLDVNPTSLSFTTESGTTSSAQTVQACNNGSADGLIFNSIAISGADAGNFSESNNCPGESPGLAEGDCCQVDVTFSPDTIRADYVASLDFDTNANDESVELTGEGTEGPPGDITISPASHDFGELLTGSESEEFTFTVTNDTGGSGSAVEVDIVSIAGDDTQFSIADDSCTGTLASGASCTVTIEFAPTADGDFSVTLTVSGEDGNGDTQSDTATAEGSGVSEARFSSNPPPGTVNLGTGQGGATLSRNVVISNEGNETLIVGAEGCTISDPDNAFTFSPDPVTFSIAPDESDTLAVSCVVPEVGSVSAGLTCDTNDPNNASVSYTFTCNSRPLVVSTLQPWGLILLTLMMLAIGGFSIRFFRVS